MERFTHIQHQRSCQPSVLLDITFGFLTLKSRNNFVYSTFRSFVAHDQKWYVQTACDTAKASSVPKGSLRHVIAFEFLYFFISEFHVHGTYEFVMKR